jgi:hypothetical protein
MNQVPPIPPIWTSLEIAKLVVSALTPLVVVIIGLWISRSLKRLEYLQWTNQKVTEKRIEVFEELAPLLNDILCYFTFVGCWKDLTAPEVVKQKRKMDRIFHVNEPLFSKDFGNHYRDFIGACYGTYAGWGKDAKLLTLSERRKKAAGSAWKVEWDSCFADKDKCPDPDLVKSKYESLMSCFSDELGVGLHSDQVSSGRIPANIK